MSLFANSLGKLFGSPVVFRRVAPSTGGDDVGNIVAAASRERHSVISRSCLLGQGTFAVDAFPTADLERPEPLRMGVTSGRSPSFGLTPLFRCGVLSRVSLAPRHQRSHIPFAMPLSISLRCCCPRNSCIESPLSAVNPITRFTTAVFPGLFKSHTAHPTMKVSGFRPNSRRPLRGPLLTFDQVVTGRAVGPLQGRELGLTAAAALCVKPHRRWHGALRVDWQRLLGSLGGLLRLSFRSPFPLVGVPLVKMLLAPAHRGFMVFLRLPGAVLAGVFRRAGLAPGDGKGTFVGNAATGTGSVKAWIFHAREYITAQYITSSLFSGIS